MFCQNCGKEINETDKFCSNCGCEILKKDNNVETAIVDKHTYEQNNIDISKDENSEYYDTIPLSKVIIMSIFTFGIYDLFFFAKYWDRYSKITNKRLSPGLRGFFGWIFFFDLAPKMSKYYEKYNIKVSSTYGLLIPLGYFLAILTRNLLIGYLVSFIFLISIQKRINKINEKFHPNAHIDNWNYKDLILFLITLVILIAQIISLGNSYQ